MSLKNTANKYNDAFDKHLHSLNPAQQEAVATIEGPMMVIAGPGTGKTHILTARIGRILRETDTHPQNILCLTFTDAGVFAMRERLLELIGPEAHRVHIYTFHSFCNNVIQENMERFGRHDLEPLNELERIEILRQLVDQLPSDHLLRQRSNDVYYYEKHLNNLFRQMKTENWTPQLINTAVDDYLLQLPELEEFRYQRNTKDAKKGDLKQWKYDEAVERMTYLRAGAELYPQYVQLMERTRRYDFDDMILWVLRAFQEDEALLRTYQEKYLYFLVDEYQDTNGAQNQILRELISYWENPNIFIVGDDDQSIFEFQGARLKNLTDFYEEYQSSIKLVLLNDNYRSSQNILDSSRAVIDHNQNRIVHNLDQVEKVLQAKSDHFATSSILPDIIAYENHAQEEADIVDQLSRLYEEDYPLNEVAVIYAKHRQIRNIITLLEKKNIPYNTRKQVNILDLPLIMNLRLFLEYVYSEYEKPYSGESLLYRILHFNFLNIPSSDIAKVSLHLARKSEDLYWRDFIGDEMALRKLGVQQPAQLLQFSSLLNELIGNYPDFTLLVLIEKIINKSGLLANLLASEDKDWQLQVIGTFFNFVQKENDRNPRLTLKQLLEIFDNMDANRLSIRIQKTIHATDGVNLVTAHSSKGLEFQQVFMLDCIKDQWEPSKRASSRRFRLPDTLTFSGTTDAMEARRRLFYVAMTRAKENLHISYSTKDNVGKSLQRVQYIDEILASIPLEVAEKKPDTNTMIDAQILLLLDVEKPRILEADRAAIDSLLEGFTLSITSLNRFLRCPLSFYYLNILKIPSVQSEAASYGIAMHYAFSKIFEKRVAAPDHQLPSVEDTIGYFRAEMKRLRGYFTKAEYARRQDMGAVHLQQYYNQYQSTWPNKIIVEHPIRNTTIEGVPVVGTIDRIDFKAKDKAVKIVDYKTGRPSSSKFASFTEKNPNGGLYRRQLLFYKLLYEAHQSDYFVSEGEISYFEPDLNGYFTTKNIHYDAKDVVYVRQLVKSAYQKIMAHEFYEGCGEEQCKWCGFVKNNVMVDSFADLEGEDLDD